jgi:hypothetical protein
MSYLDFPAVCLNWDTKLDEFELGISRSEAQCKGRVTWAGSQHVFGLLCRKTQVNHLKANQP